MKSMYKYIGETWKKPYENISDLQSRLISWRKSRALVRIEKPTRLDRARSLGYKAKVGFSIVRIRLLRGGRKKPRPRGGRRSKRMGVKKTLKMNYRWVAEQRAERKYPNLVLLNSYKLAEDGIYAWYEVIFVDPNRPEIKNDKNMNWVCDKNNMNRAARGLTSAARKSRGLRNKGRRAIRIRPSQRAHDRKGK